MKQTKAQVSLYEGILFKSTIEAYMYKLLKINNIDFDYEEQSFQLTKDFCFPNPSFEKFLNGKGKFKERGKDKKHQGMRYTPDFTSPTGNDLKFVIEVKGRSFPDFPRTWKLFKEFITNKGWKTVLFVPRTQRDCKEVVTLIKELNLE